MRPTICVRVLLEIQTFLQKFLQTVVVVKFNYKFGCNQKLQLRSISFYWI